MESDKKPMIVLACTVTLLIVMVLVLIGVLATSFNERDTLQEKLQDINDTAYYFLDAILPGCSNDTVVLTLNGSYVVIEHYDGLDPVFSDVLTNRYRVLLGDNPFGFSLKSLEIYKMAVGDMDIVFDSLGVR